jgi:hypothetical protein
VAQDNDAIGRQHAVQVGPDLIGRHKLAITKIEASPVVAPAPAVHPVAHIQQEMCPLCGDHDVAPVETAVTVVEPRHRNAVVLQRVDGRVHIILQRLSATPELTHDSHCLQAVYSCAREWHGDRLGGRGLIAIWGANRLRHQWRGRVQSDIVPREGRAYYYDRQSDEEGRGFAQQGLSWFRVIFSGLWIGLYRRELTR